MGFDKEHDPDEGHLFDELNGIEPTVILGHSISSLAGPQHSGLSTTK